MRPVQVNDGPAGGEIIPPDASEPIAIVGLATRFPQQATSTEGLWEILLQARSTWSPIPKERFNADAFYHPDPDHGGTTHVQGGHFLREDPAYFDGSFFNITKQELLTLDPQQRLVMENVYHALENAGIPMTDAMGSNTSVFVSGFNHDYMGILNSDPETALKYKPTGVTNAVLSNRVSWFFDFKGPSMTIDTACSSSLVALHLAVQSLRAKETNMALVSGVSMLENPVETIGMSHHGLLGAEGRSFSFDSRAEGYARGEGVGTVVLKPLGAAVRDGDTIRAVIRETGVNQDGRTSSITVPSAEAQERLIREVYWRAGLDMERTRFVEAHGTGTSTGDPIEAGALARAFKCRRDTPLYVGTIKSSIGHLEGGSGVASLIKSILILESAIIPANFDMQQVNPRIPAADWNIAFPTQSIPWPSEGLRRVSVNSFGIGGTNAHCVLDDAYHYLLERRVPGVHQTTAMAPKLSSIGDRLLSSRQSKTPNHSRSNSSDDSDHSVCSSAFVDTPASDGVCASPSLGILNAHASLVNVPRLFMLSAFDEEGMQRNASGFAQYLRRKMSLPRSHDHLLDDLCFTLSTRRSVFSWKSFVAASTVKELAWNLSENMFAKPVQTAEPPEFCFVFTGQGAQYQAMGRALLTYPVFQESLEDASDYIRRLGSPWSLLDELLTERKSPRVNLPEVAHPLCTALQIALIDLLASWNIIPTRVVGHSSGEIAAAYCAGKLSREAAWKASYYRGYVSSKQLCAEGAMMAVGLDAPRLEPYLETIRHGSNGELIIACYNSPNNNTVSGDEALVDSLKATLDAEGIFARKLNVHNAYHSAHMKNLAGDYLQLMGNLQTGKRLPVPHSIRMFSSVTGEEVTENHLKGQYWVENMVSPVQFTSALTKMCPRSSSDDSKMPCVVEIGPHSTLQTAVKETLSLGKGRPGAKYLAVLKRTDSGLNTLLNTVGYLVVNGCPLDLHKVNTASRPLTRKKFRMLVDLPPYSFKHTEKVLYESRLSRNLRFRKFPRHDLFGAPVVDWNSSAPRWRHFVRLNENPWLKDHVVTGNYVYPGVGFLVMAIEASRQLESDKKIAGFHLRHISIKRALIIPDTKEGIEVCLSMTTAEFSTESQPRRRFQINSYNNSSDEWTEHCTGYIHVEIDSPLDPVDQWCEDKEEARAWREGLGHAHSICTRPMNFRTTYNNLQTSGLDFGPLFRNLDDVRASGSNLGAMTGAVTVPDIAQAMPKQYMHDHLIHPATMDSMIHMMIAAVLDYTGKPSLDMIRLPTFIRDVWVSASLSSVPLYKYIGHASVSVGASDKFEGQVRILDQEHKDQKIRMDGIELTPLESILADKNERHLCTGFEWKPDLHFLGSRSACELSATNDTDYNQDCYWVKRLQLAAMLFITDALAEIRDLDLTRLDLHMCRFYDWMNYMNDQLLQDKIVHLPYSEYREAAENPAKKSAIFDEIEAHSAEGVITVRMGRNIASVMRQEVDPLHLMFGQDAIMEEVYNEGLHLCDLPKHLQNHLSLLRHQRSQLNVLEIGAGTGSFTQEVLNVLSPQPHTTKGSIASYKFTDISASFFEKAKHRFEPWSDIMTFGSLNIERSPIDQGFEAGSYDVIFAGNVVHATADLNTALCNLRSLLKPGGQLIMQEGTRQDFLWYPLVFGQLPGWWLGNEPIRQWCPYIPASEWNKSLTECGFSGINIEYPSSANEDLTWQSILVSTATPLLNKLPEEIIILSYDTSVTADTIKILRQMFPRIDDRPKVNVMTPSELDNVCSPNAIYISLVDLERPLLYEIDESEFEALKKTMMECNRLLWLTPDTREKPFSNMSMGLLRTMRWERDLDRSNIVTLAVENPGNVSASDLAICIRKIIQRQFLEQTENDRHAEYLLRNNVIHIGRLCEWEQADNFLAVQSSNLTPEMQRLGDLKRPIELVPSSVRSENLHWTSSSKFQASLGDTEVEVEIRAVGLNPDAGSACLSHEAAGTVTRVGLAVEGLIVGDNVVMLAGDERNHCLRTFARVDQTLVIKLPKNLSFQMAASLPLTFATVLYGLGDAAVLTGDDTVLIHTGASALGQAAIQYAKMVGAEVFTTVTMSEDRIFLSTEYGIPQNQIFSCKDFSFAKGVMRRTQGAGVDVIFNTLTGEGRRQSLGCLGSFGRFIDLCEKTTRGDASIELPPLQGNVSMTSIDMPLMIQRRPKLVRRLLTKVLKLYTEGKFGRTQPTTVMDFTQIREGLEARHSERPGKIVLTPDPSNLIPVAPEVMSPYQFDAGASYILAGGLGGLGRSLARWMASRGARSLIFLSRSGRITEPVESMVADLKNLSCGVHIFTCDVADAERLRDVVQECSRTLPPIKGCIQGSMALKDGVFASMSFADWQTAIRPKVQGSWNLHETLPVDLDFFVMLSSVAGIFGNRGQSNYAAGNTFQDALAAFRTVRGMKASTINLGSVSSVGWVAENRNSMRTHTATLFELLREDEVHAAIEFLIDPRLENNNDLDTVTRSQLVLGLPTAEICRQNGIPSPTYLNYSLFTHLRFTSAVTEKETCKSKTISTAALLGVTSSKDEAVAVISSGIVERLSSLLAIPSSELDVRRFGFGGIDSLVAMEFRSWVTRELKAEVSLLDIIGAQNITSLSDKIAQTSRLLVTNPE